MSIQRFLVRHPTRLTKARTAVLATLSRSARPLSIDQLVTKLRTAHLNQATIYRAVNVLCRAGHVRRLDFGQRHAVYEVDRGDHHHHLICQRCHRVEHVEVPQEYELIRRLERRHRFITLRHSLELFGRCARCR